MKIDTPAPRVLYFVINSPEVECFTLFATHFHEMSRLADEVPRVRNAHMRANVRTDPASGKKALTFLYEVADGPTDQSYGVEVAEMVNRAKHYDAG